MTGFAYVPDGTEEAALFGYGTQTWVRTCEGARREMRRERELKLPRRPTAAAQDGALTPPAAAQRQPKLMAAAAQTTAATF